jgi:hypothetical protein
LEALKVLSGSGRFRELNTMATSYRASRYVFTIAVYGSKQISALHKDRSYLSPMYTVQGYTFKDSATAITAAITYHFTNTLHLITQPAILLLAKKKTIRRTHTNLTHADLSHEHHHTCRATTSFPTQRPHPASQIHVSCMAPKPRYCIHF